VSEPRAIVLDFDGIVLESVEVKAHAFVALFADYPEHHDRITRLHRDNAGMSRYEKFRRIYRELLNRPYDEGEEARLGERFSEIVLGEMLVCPFVHGAPEFLDWAAARTPLYLASATPQEELRLIVERRHLSPLFAGAYGTPRAKSEILADICAEVDADPGELVFVGDAAADREAARAAGVPFVGRRPPGLPLPFAAEDVVLVVDDLEQLRVRWDDVTAALPASA
jgi:phosphoglycolate phosphatase-like HAD superfamily hydrolase